METSDHFFLRHQYLKFGEYYKMSEHHITKGEDRVPFAQKLGVGLGAFPFITGSMVVNYLGLPIFQLFLGMNPMLFGLAMTIPRFWDAFTDPIMGRISDRYQSKYGRRRPFVFVGAFLMAIAFISIWMVPQGWGEMGMFAWLVITSILFFTAYTIYAVPCYALACELTPDYHERTRVMVVWAIFINIGNLALMWYAPITNWEIFETPLIGARYIGLILGILVFVLMGIMPAILGRERYQSVTVKSDEKIGFFIAIKQAASSKPMLGLVGIVFALNFGGTIAGSIALYIVIYHVKGGDVEGGMILNSWNGTGFVIVGFLGILLLRWMALNFGKKRAMYVVLSLTFLGGISKWFIFTPDLPYLMLLDSILNGPIWVSLGVIVPSMIADLCDWDEWKFGERRAGIISSVFNWITKFGTSFTFLVTGIAVSFSGFDETLGANQPEGTMTALRVFFVGASVLAPIIAMLCLRLYPIGEKEAYQIRKELEERRGKV